jgi:glucokinase
MADVEAVTREGGRVRTLVAGVDIGGSKVAALIVGPEDAVVGRAVRSMGRTSGPAEVEPVVAAIRAALADAHADQTALAAIGMGVPGLVDPDAGTVLLAVNLAWRDCPLGELVANELGVPSAVENDVRIAAAGLIGRRAADGARSLAYVAVGTGIAAGLVFDGRPYRGVRGAAGEIGHIVVEPEGSACACGQHGCLETVASGPAIARLAGEALAAGAESPLATVEVLTARAVYDAARDGDRLALELADRAGRALGRAIIALVMTCDLERVLLGGGVAAAGDVFLTPILAELERSRTRSATVAELLRPGSVRLLPPDYDAVAWGGVALARRRAGMAERGRDTRSMGDRLRIRATAEGSLLEQ